MNPGLTHRMAVELPRSLCQLSGAPQLVHVELTTPFTQRRVLDAIEQLYPALDGTIRDHTTRQRRPFIRFFVAEQDLSHLDPDEPLPFQQQLIDGKATFLIIGAIAGGTGVS